MSAAPGMEGAPSAAAHGRAQWIGDGPHRVVELRHTRRSRFVGLMKLSLPLAALVLVALIIAWPQLYSRYDRLNLSFAKVEVGDHELRMASPRYQGMDANGRPYLVTADTATQIGTEHQIVKLTNIHADMALDNGGWATLTAKHGIYHEDEKVLWLEGDVSVYSDDGYEFHSPTATCNVNTGEVSSDDPVKGQGPTGLLDANAFWLADKGNHMRFTKGVKMTLYPQDNG
ncbi:MAG TPA: LPS export ABC transporter periplasmic protein LptC [Candidatus Sulfotelmatobacter sp.]|nr:LPS export ABC transporter periplasmic protein LptC [Candidatus Sulfotelmatobacter sp.]